jgi:hypothetical protein
VVALFCISIMAFTQWFFHLFDVVATLLIMPNSRQLKSFQQYVVVHIKYVLVNDCNDHWCDYLNDNIDDRCAMSKKLHSISSDSQSAVSTTSAFPALVPMFK